MFTKLRGLAVKCIALGPACGRMVSHTLRRVAVVLTRVADAIDALIATAQC